MHSFSLLSVLACTATALSLPSSHVEKRAQTVYLAGDSTMARANGAITGTQYQTTRQVSNPISIHLTASTRLGCLPPLLPLHPRNQ
jgi:rhamnogalacturonan acetylesterase